jgi:hypothetical protein
MRWGQSFFRSFAGVPFNPFFELADGARFARRLGLSAITSTNKGETGEWFSTTWGFAKQDEKPGQDRSRRAAIAGDRVGVVCG